MIDTQKRLEKYLQNQRFKRSKKYLNGDVLDFGGNEGELKPYVKGNYLLINYDHTGLEDHQFDSIVSTAVIEHIDYDEVFKIFSKFKKVLRKDGNIFLTTPTLLSKPLLELLAFFGLLDKQNIEEHKHYWNKKELNLLAEKNGFKLVEYKKFQLGFNQYAIFKHQ